MNVPNGFVICSDIYEEYIRGNKIDSFISVIFPKQSKKKHGKLYYREMEYNKVDGNTGMVVKVKNG